MTAEQLSALLHEHVRKCDPVDVANLAMMLHQNGQRIEQQPAPDVAALQAELEREIQRRFDGNEQASREHREDMKSLVRALEDIAGTHHHSASAGEYFAKVARAALAAHRKETAK